MFEITDLHVHFGVIHAIKGISLVVNDGEIVTLIGANGAGKTTTLRTASGLKKATSGTISIDGVDITNKTPRQRVQMGLCQVPEGRRVFPTMTVLENLELGAYLRKRGSDLAADLETVYASFPVLADRRKQLAGTLSGGEQQMLAIGRALMARPKLLLLDEPSMGLAPMVIQQIFRIISEINRQGTTVLLVEQNAQQALTRSDRAYILETGEVTRSGNARELLADDSIRAAAAAVAAHRFDHPPGLALCRAFRHADGRGKRHHDRRHYDLEPLAVPPEAVLIERAIDLSRQLPPPSAE